MPCGAPVASLAAPMQSFVAQLAQRVLGGMAPVVIGLDPRLDALPAAVLPGGAPAARIVEFYRLTLPVALGNFLAADDSPWELLMTAGFLYALPPAAIYYAFRRYMSSGLTAGAVKG